MSDTQLLAAYLLVGSGLALIGLTTNWNDLSKIKIGFFAAGYAVWPLTVTAVVLYTLWMVRRERIEQAALAAMLPRVGDRADRAASSDPSDVEHSTKPA